MPIPYKNNSKKHPDAQLKKIAKSLAKFGWRQPIVVDKDDVIIVGHGRWEAYKKYPAGIKEPRIEIADDLTPEEVSAYRIADNKLNESEWDMGLVIEELKGLSEEMFDLTGFDKDLLIEPDEADDIIPENVPLRSKLGDLYELGGHRVLCGDSTQSEAVLRLMDGKKAELLFTSPPYSDMREYGGGKDLSVCNLVNFINVFSDYVKYQVINLGIKRDNYEIVSYWDEYIAKARECGYRFLAWNVWAKQNAGSVGNQSSFIPISHEWIFVFGKDFKDINRIEKRKTAIKKGKQGRTVRQPDGSMSWSTFGTQKELKEMESVYYQVAEMGSIRKLHPATFPVDLAGKYIRSITNQDDIVVDAFLGSGSTLIASEKTGRICYGMELDPKYIDVIVQRYVDYIGNENIKLNGVDIIWKKSKIPTK